MSEPKLYMLVGLPGVGKSTYIKEMLVENPTAIIISSDNIIEGFAADLCLTYNEAFLKYKDIAHSQMMQEARYHIEAKDDIIWDQTNLTEKTRKNKLKLFPKEYYKEALIFVTSAEEHARRLTLRPGKIIPEFVMQTMQESYTMPKKEEGFDSIRIIKT